MLVMDRENPHARGWSHVLSTTDDLAELEAFRRRIGAPPSALQRPTRTHPTRRLHLDVCRTPRQRALALDGVAVRVYDSAFQMMRDVRDAQSPSQRIATPDHRATDAP